ncbi:histidine phosphatase family protein [Microbacterium sp. MEC084]|uniref:histidine phosphatase family protein n=1 Tax=Microbacterium sp. MEC084 TaxID=1963027 RepID=UPI00106F793F|nr:histidine phosphatase family protein [Microbacterium sp. MEC084]MCD1267441.1 histidine phosphatase family protein [Microbacterium sp. MEC084]
MTLLALVRHGQTDWNAERRIQGRTDIPLNDTGRAQDLLAAEALRDGGWQRIASSTLGRATETAEIIASALGLEPPATHPGLMERDYGVAEGTLVADFHARYDGGVPVPGAETHEELTERALAALAEVVAQEPDAPTIVVAHGGVIRGLLGHASNGALPRPGERIDNASVTLFRMTDDGLVLAADERESVGAERGA